MRLLKPGRLPGHQKVKFFLVVLEAELQELATSLEESFPENGTDQGGSSRARERKTAECL